MVQGILNGLTKDDIPYEAQIIRVADEYDAIVSKRQYKSHVDIIDTLRIIIDETKPEDNSNDNIKIPTLGKNNPIIVKALIKVIIDDTEYEISCIMDYLKDLKSEIKRLEEVEKYDKKRLSSSTDDKKNYYLEGMKYLLIGQETIDNYAEILNSYRNIVKTKSEHIDKLFEVVKTIKKMKF